MNSVLNFNSNWNFVGLLHHPFWLQLVLTLWVHLFQLIKYFVWPRITDQGSLPEMRIWSILLIKSDLKWCIHVHHSRSPFYIRIYIMRPHNLIHWSKKVILGIVEIAPWIVEPLLGIFDWIFSLFGVYFYLCLLFNIESAFSCSQIGKYFEFSWKLWYDAWTCTGSTASMYHSALK